MLTNTAAMDRRILLSLLAAAALGILGLWLLTALNPPRAVSDTPLLPWDVSRAPTGEVRVFGLTLGHSRLEELRALLGEPGKLSLFVAPGGDISAEAFFKDIMLSRIRADWVASLAVPEGDLAAMFERGLRIASLAQGTRKVSLAPEDAEKLSYAPLRALTYLPRQKLAARDIAGNFGEPAERVQEEHGIVHWLYPDLGLDIARAADGAVVIQYLNPAQFARARARLAPPASAAD